MRVPLLQIDVFPPALLVFRGLPVDINVGIVVACRAEGLHVTAAAAVVPDIKGAAVGAEGLFTAVAEDDSLPGAADHAVCSLGTLHHVVAPSRVQRDF